MDDILEIVFEVVMEFVIELAADKTMPKWLRYLMSFLAAVILLAVAGALVWAGTHVLGRSVTAGILYFAIIGALVLGFAIFCLRKRSKKKKEKELEPLEKEWQ